MKILLLTDGISPYVIGGMQKHSFNLVKYLAKNEIEVHLFHTNQSDLKIENLEFFTEEEKNYIVSYVIPFPKKGKLPGHYIRRSYHYSKEVFIKVKPILNNFDFIIAKGFAGWKLVEEKNKGLDCPPIGINMHGYEMYQKPANFKSIFINKFFRMKVNPILKKADFVFSYGGKITNLLNDIVLIPMHKIIEIPGGIEKSWINENELKVNKPLKFVFVGRFERRKGIEELTDALNRLSSELKFEFIFIGPIPESKKNIDNRIKYLGEIREPEKIKNYLQESDILICPSHSEGMPNVILEGMASGLTIVGTDVGAVSMMVNHSNGFLIEKGSSKAIVEIMEFLLGLEETKILTMKNNSREMIKNNFVWDKIIFKTLKSIDHVIKS